MDRLEALIATIIEEDRRLREMLAVRPVVLLDQCEAVGSMSAKEALGHLAFWDAFTVRFFEARFADRKAEAGLADFEERDRQERRRLRAQPFTEVLGAYREATDGLLTFLRTHWRELSERERAELITPLRHRRHHRLLLERALADVPAREDEPPRQESGRA